MPDETTQEAAGTEQEAVGQQQSVSSTVDSGAFGRPPEETGGFSFESIVPDEYKERDYVKQIMEAENPSESLFQQFDNLQKKLGERPKVGIPGEDASDEERAEFYKALGVPESADEYEINNPEWSEDQKFVGEYYDSIFEGDFKKDVQELFKQHNVPKDVAAAISKQYMELGAQHFGDAIKEMYESSAAQNADFDKLTKQYYGEESVKVFDTAKKALEEFGDPTLKSLAQDPEVVSNRALIAFAKPLAEMYNKLKEEDGAVLTSKSGGNAHQDAMALGNKLIAERNKLDPMDPRVNDLQNKIDEHFRQAFS